MGPSYRDPRAFELLGQSGLCQLIEKALPQDNRDKTGSNTDRGDDLLDSYNNDMYDYDRAYSAGYYWVATSDPVAMREPFDWVRKNDDQLPYFTILHYPLCTVTTNDAVGPHPFLSPGPPNPL